MNKLIPMNDRLAQLLSIDPDNEFLTYIVARLQRDDYRGMHVSQHNRLTFDFVGQVLTVIRRFASDCDFPVPP